MAKRSDFAQKLLDDLRLRKERMASSQRSNQSHQLPIDAYAYSKQTYRGSRNTKASEIVGSKTGDMLNRSSRSHKSADTGGVSSNQIVPYGRGQSSVQRDDMSLALAFAFENGGKLRRADSSYANSVMSFLNQITRGTMEFGMTERRSNLDRQLAPTRHYPTLSPAQINEISKGAQKLNQILRACSNGLNIDRYSIEFAKQLLQGCIDLEESLRMLVDVQKSSEFMITSQKKTKNRITLLEEDNDDDDDDDHKIIKISDHKQLARPIFSFDKLSSRHPQNVQEVGKASFMRRPVTLTNSKEGRNSNNEKKNVKTPEVSQKRSPSSNMKNLNAISERKNQTASVQSNSNPEKGGIPNVIAKLMGLDNLPEKMESKHMPQKDSGYTQKIEGNQGMTSKHAAKGSTKKTELKNKKTQNLAPMKNQKVIEAFNMPATQDEELVFGADKNLHIQKASSEVVAQNGKPRWRDLDGIKALKGFEKASSIKIDKHHNSSAEKNLTGESRKDVQVKGSKQDHTNNREQKGTINGRTNDPLLNNMLAQLEQVDGRSEVKSSFQEEKEINGSIIQLEKRHTNKHTMNNQKKSRNHLGVQKSHTVSKYGPQEDKHYREQQVRLREEQMLSVRPQGGSEAASKNSSKPHHQLISPQKKQLPITQAMSFKQNSGENVDAVKSEGFLSAPYDDLVRDVASNDTNAKVKETINRKSSQISSPRNPELEPTKGRHGIMTLMDEKSVHKLASKKIKNTRKQKVDMARKIDEVLAGRNGAKLIAKQVKQQIPSLQEARHRTSDKSNVLQEAVQEKVSMFKEADAHIISSKESVAAAEPLDVRRRPHEEAELPPRCGELQSLQEPVTSVPNDLHYQDVQPVAMGLQGQVVPVAADEEFKTGEIALNKINGIHEEKMDISNYSQLQDQNIPEKRHQEPLTESENSLKWILVTSQIFLNTAEALFRLNIPFSILQDGVHGNQGEGSKHGNQGEGSKLILDCGYEVMKRKGIRQELKVHPCSKISVSSTIHIGSLDDLVRQLNKDMEKLEFYGRNRSSQVDVEAYLPKMLEHDVYDKEPDIDCMWDLGWKEETFAFIEKYDVIRDAEKHILNVLLDEITAELMHVDGGLNVTLTTIH